MALTEARRRIGPRSGPGAAPLNGMKMIPMLAAIGVVLSVGVALYLRESGHDSARAMLDRVAAEYHRELEERIGSQVLLLQALRGQFSGHSSVTRDDFAAAVDPVRPFFPSLQAVSWLRRVPVRDVAGLEGEARADGLSGFSVSAGAGGGAGGGLGVENDDLFVAFFVEPRAGNEFMLGVDVAAQPERRAVLERACATGRLTATEDIPPGEGVGPASLVLFMPVYRAQGAPADPAARCTGLSGYLMAEFLLGRLLDEAFNQRPLPGGVYLVDATASGGRRLLASLNTAAHGLPETLPDGPALEEATVIVHPMEVGGRRWELTVVAPEPGNFESGRLEHWVALAIGLLLTGLLTAYLHREARGKLLLQAEARARAAMARMLRESEERFRLALRHSRVSVFSQDRRLRYVWVYNPQVPLPPERFIGRRDAELFPAEAAATLEAAKQAVLFSGIGTRQEVRIPWGDGVYVFDLVVEPLRDDSEEVTGVICAAIDITESNRIKEALAEAHAEAERANQAKTRFLAAASHDLRQPFQAMSLFHHILMAKLTDPKTVEVASKLGEALAGGNALLNALLDTSALEVGNVKPRIGDFACQDITDRLATEIADQAARKGLSFRMVPTSARVRSDPVLLERMVRNLLVNALRYTEKGGILLGCRRRGGRLCIEVWDSGPGIPPEHRQRIFEDFYRCGVDQPDNSGGLGLGLSIVRRTAQILDHPVTVQSRVGRGTVFSVSIPLAESQHEDESVTDALSV